MSSDGSKIQQHVYINININTTNRNIRNTYKCFVLLTVQYWEGKFKSIQCV